MSKTLNDFMSALEQAALKLPAKNLYLVNPICRHQDSDWKAVYNYIELNKEKGLNALAERVELFDNLHLKEFTLDFLKLRTLIELIKLIQEDSRVYFIGLSLELVGSEFFKLFDGSLDKDSRKQVSIGFHISDFFRHPKTFDKCNTKLKKAGYLTHIYGVNAMVFPYVDNSVIGFDHLLLDWDNTLRLKRNHINKAQDSSLQLTKTEQIILRGCTSATAINTGIKQDIQLFEGPFVSTALKEDLS